MLDQEELLFVVDGKNNPLLPLPRSLAHKKLLWHRTTGIWVINNNKQILCQRRSLLKDTKPGFWCCFFGGHMSPNEEYVQNAVIELKEELGINLSEKDLIPFKILKSDKPTHKEFQQIFACVVNGDINNFKFEKDEIDQIAWIDLDEVRGFLLNKKNNKWVQKPWDKEVLTWIEKI